MNGGAIDSYTFRPSAAAIAYSAAYEQEQARIYAGMSMAEYDSLPGTPEWCVGDERSKSHILMLYRMSNTIPAVASDAQARKAEHDMKAKRKGR